MATESLYTPLKIGERDPLFFEDSNPSATAWKRNIKSIGAIFLIFAIGALAFMSLAFLHVNEIKWRDSLASYSMKNLIIMPSFAANTCAALDLHHPMQSKCWTSLSNVDGAHFSAHLSVAIDLARKDPNALLMFTGKKEAAYSAYKTAQMENWLGYHHVARRTIVEDSATDSYEVFLYSIANFKRLTGHYPQNVKMVGFPWLSDRYAGIIAKKLQYPSFQYWSVIVGKEDASLRDGASLHYRHDPFNCRAHQTPETYRVVKKSYLRACPELIPAFFSCSTGGLLGSKLPWEKKENST